MVIISCANHIHRKWLRDLIQ